MPLIAACEGYEFRVGKTHDPLDAGSRQRPLDTVLVVDRIAWLIVAEMVGMENARERALIVLKPKTRTRKIVRRRSATPSCTRYL